MDYSNLSLSLLESIGTATSDGSMIEARIRQLKDQLRARKEEARRIQSEQRRKKKNLLRQQEDELKRKLEVGGWVGGCGLDHFKTGCV